jgi:hypothetical protein
MGQGVLIGDGVYLWMHDYQREGAWRATRGGVILADGVARNIHDAICLFRLGGRAGYPVRRFVEPILAGAAPVSRPEGSAARRCHVAPIKLPVVVVAAGDLVRALVARELAEKAEEKGGLLARLKQVRTDERGTTK